MVRRYGVCVMASLTALVAATASKAQQPPQFAQDRMGGFAAVRFPVVSPLAKPQPLPTPAAAQAAARPLTSHFIPVTAHSADPATPVANPQPPQQLAPAATASGQGGPGSTGRKDTMPYCK